MPSPRLSNTMIPQPRPQRGPFSIDHPQELLSIPSNSVVHGNQEEIKPEFHHFSALPIELRFQIWKNALPDPKVLELSLAEKTPPQFQPSTQKFPENGNFDYPNLQWVSGKPTSPPTLLFVCREAMSVVKENYVLLNAYDQSSEIWQKIHWDYSRDCFYFSRRSWERLLGSAADGFQFIKELSMEPLKTRHLAISTRLLHRWVGSHFAGSHQFTNPAGRELRSGVLSKIFSLFTHLKTFHLAIDGREPNTDGPDLLVPATEEHSDHYVQSGREDYVGWISSIVAEFLVKYPEPRIPTFELGLLINEEPLHELERRWDYYYATCRFYTPGFSGHRRVSRSPISHDSDAFDHSESSESESEEGDDAVLNQGPPVNGESRSDSESDSDSNPNSELGDPRYKTRT